MSHNLLQLEYEFSSQGLHSVSENPPGHCSSVYTLHDSPLQPSWHLQLPLLPLQRPWPLHVVIMSHNVLHICE